jgi:CRISPR-associated endonuclease Cas1
LRIYVRSGQLQISDGQFADRRTRRLHRVTSGLERLVVIGHTGYVTFDALRWIADIGAAFVQINSDGRLLTTSIANGPDLAALRRAQALAAGSGAGVELARAVLAQKVAGQRAVLDELPHTHNAGETVDAALWQIGEADTLQSLLLAESQAAEAYWGAWASLPIPFPARDRAKLPSHWQTFGQRASLLSKGPRHATNPAGAILNYLYALLEAETTLACHAIGLDPGLGIFHVDQRDRDSLALDLMEAVRPLVDSYVLALLTQRTLNPSDFAETRRGICRLKPRLASELTETITAWRHHIAPIVEQTAHTLADSSPARLPLLTPLTRANQRSAWDERAPNRRVHQLSGTGLALPASCRACGSPLPNRRRRYCDDCRREQLAKQASAGRANAAAVLARLRAEQRDPRHGGRAAQIRGTKNAAHQRANHAWTGGFPDPAVFATDILPGLRQRSVPDLAAATGLSEHYCSLIRLGKRVPHPRHWGVLRAGEHLIPGAAAAPH